jgi:hypothetical protein
MLLALAGHSVWKTMPHFDLCRIIIPRRRWEDNIKMDLWEVGCGGADRIDLAQDRDRWWALVYTVMNLRVPLNAGNFLSSLGHFSFSGRTLLHGVSLVFGLQQINHDIKSQLWTFNFSPASQLQSYFKTAATCSGEWRKCHISRQGMCTVQQEYSHCSNYSRFLLLMRRLGYTVS